ncbi:transcriptional regulator [Edwardsiella hoshinae]|uniref:Transcriptional regulator n=1 Tax=Edwardsiella hoshinae TaxID=93378 RepID=A0A376D8B7_9GAMM|nr:helix-turn-helix transcriptional regulator [Edwardsiella hoshinae]AOV95997.1 transcriptional regulator [Edwardsiella hoshinae]QPR28126.1 helix-turn-helix transcriptional regulator [Edwardsiella hoshinae]STC84747.1 ATP-dependent transcriptional regulator [Edwardsiella hoshinae]
MRSVPVTPSPPTRRVYLVTPNPLFATGLAALLTPHLDTHCYPSLATLLSHAPLAGRVIVCPGQLNSQHLAELSQQMARLRRRYASALPVLAIIEPQHAGLTRVLCALGFDSVLYDARDLSRWLWQLACWLDAPPAGLTATVRPYLTERELRVLKWSAQGLSLALMAEQCGVSVKCLYTQRRTALHKLGLTRTREWQQLATSLLQSPTFAIKRRRTASF